MDMHAHLRDELLTLVLAGHETTANSLAWTWERLVRTPEAYERLRDAVRALAGLGPWFIAAPATPRAGTGVSHATPSPSSRSGSDDGPPSEMK
jgi:cytochrome P450